MVCVGVGRFGARMAAECFALRAHVYTGVFTMIARDDPADTSRYTIYESASRIRKDGDGTYQYATLWERERKYQDGELKKEKIKDEIETDWAGMGQQMAMAVPFSRHSGDQYNYEIQDRKLIGMNLVYKMSYQPRDQFAALPSGTVWVDYSDWVIRRVEASFDGAVPVPLFLKAIPVYKARRVKRGDWWVLNDIFARMEMRHLPLLKIPRLIEFHYRTYDHQINGVVYDADDPKGLGGGAAGAGDDAAGGGGPSDAAGGGGR
jgi:hypothetical protein